MSLKYRLIVLTTVVLAITFGIGTMLGVHGARRLAEAQLRSRLETAAKALAGSSAPLNEEVLKRFAPVLRAQILVLDERGRMLAHSGAQWPWQELAAQLAAAPTEQEALEASGQRYYFVAAEGRKPVTAERVRVILLADEQAVRQPTQAILYGYLILLFVTAVPLSGGMYLVGLGLVRRIRRLNRAIDQTAAEEPAAAPRRGDELDRLSGAFQDLLRRLQHSRERLAAQQRLATTGKLASSVAHEVRNPLQAIRLTVQMIQQSCPEASRQGCELILSEIDRLALLTDELLVLAGAAAPRVESVDLQRELRETLRLLDHQLRQWEVRTEVKLGPLPPVRMDRNRCRQLLLNLLLNAAEASPRGQTIRLAAWAGGGNVVIRIADSGPGFPLEVLQGREEEFFSTKAAGAGLGLSICRRIVAETRGRLELCNADGGAVAEVTLPAAEAPSGACGEAGPPAAPLETV